MESAVSTMRPIRSSVRLRMKSTPGRRPPRERVAERSAANTVPCDTLFTANNRFDRKKDGAGATPRPRFTLPGNTGQDAGETRKVGRLAEVELGARIQARLPVALVQMSRQDEHPRGGRLGLDVPEQLEGRAAP